MDILSLMTFIQFIFTSTILKVMKKKKMYDTFYELYSLCYIIIDRHLHALMTLCLNPICK